MRPHLLLISLFLVSLLGAQNLDSLNRAYVNATHERSKPQIEKLSEKLGLYYEKQGEPDSVVHYFTVAAENATSPVKKADYNFHQAKAIAFSDPLLSSRMAIRGFQLVKDTAVAQRTTLSNLLGVYYSLNGKYDSSFYYYDISLKTATQLKDTLYITKVKSNLGDLYSYKGEFGTALKYQLDVLSTFEQQKDSVNIIRTMVNVGNTYVYMEDSKTALEYFNRVYPQLQDSKTRLAGNLFNSMAVAYSDEKDYKHQEEFLLKSLAVKEVLHDSTGIGNTYVNLGLLKDSLGDEKAAIDYFSRSFDVAKKISNRRIIRICGMELGDIYLKNKDYRKALDYFLPVVPIAEDDEDLDSRSQVYKRIYKAYVGLGDYKNAFDYYHQYVEMQDSINNVENVKVQARAEAAYTEQKNQREKDQLKYQNELSTLEKERATREKSWTIAISVIGLVVLLVIFFLVYRNARIRARAKEEIVVMESEQRERMRISRDLHDNVGTQLSLISNNIEWITHPLKELSEEEKKNKLEYVGVTAKEVIATLRETIWALNKEEISFEEFSDKLKSHVQKQVQLAPEVKPAFRETLEEELRLGPSEALGLFRICQEAIANSLKYASADSLVIDLQAKAGKFAVTIADNGKGFDPQQPNGSAHYGLENMKHRAEEISCRFEIESSPGTGTRITVVRK